MTRAQIEAFRRAEGISVDSASLLERMTQSGLLCKVRTDRRLGAPNVYSVTTKALRAAADAAPVPFRLPIGDAVGRHRAAA